MKIILTLISFVISFSLAAQNTIGDTIQNYLKQNMEVVSDNEAAEIKMFDADFYKNSLFLFGENHGSANPQLVDIKLFKQLYKNAGVRYYVAEVDDTKAWMLNNYMKDGNESWLKKVFSSWISDTAQWANKSNYAKFQQLQLFYKSLPKKAKFTILGIDVVQDYSLLKEHIKYFTANKKEPIVQIYMDSLQSILDTTTFDNSKNFIKFTRRLLIKMDEDNSGYKKLFAEKTDAFKHFIKSVAILKSGMNRDSVMYTNMNNLIKTYNLTNTKMYGFLGFYHCLQISYENAMPFAALLSKYNSSFTGKIASVQMMALNCKTLLPYIAQMKQMMPLEYVQKLRKENTDFVSSTKYAPFDLSNDGSIMKIDGIQYLKNITDSNKTYIFKLNSTNTPFASTKKLGEVTGFQTVKFTSPNANTLQGFQYILFFRNSKAGVPIE